MDYKAIIHSVFSEPATAVSYKDGKVRVLDINDRYLSEMWLNIPEEEYISAGFHDIYDDENLRIFISALKVCAESGKEQNIETWRRLLSECCGESSVCLRSRLILIEKNDDEAIIYESIRNITEEKKILRELQDAEYRYKQASEQINIYNWEYYIDTKQMRPCYRCMRDLGVPAVVENYPEPVIESGIFPPDYADTYREFMKRVDAGETGLEIDVPLTVGRVPFRIKYTTEFDDSGKPVKAFASATLISETELGHIKVDNQIISSLAEEYVCIYMADFVKNEVKVVKETDLMSLKENAGCADLLCMVAGRLEDIDEDGRQKLCDPERVRSDLFKDSEKREFVYKDDTDNRWVRIDMHIIERGEKEKVDRLLVTFSLIDDLRAQKMDADRLIAEQKKALEDRQSMLIAAIDEANHANRAKTAFFSNMSHDIRTPMNAITGFSRLAVEEIDNRERVADYLDKIVTAGDHLLNLINDILDMSQIESGKMELAYSPVKIKDLILECADMTRVKMDENKLDFEVDVTNVGDDIVECDKLRFCQMILNLLSNAYKYTPEGGSVLFKGELKSRSDLMTYEIRIKDTGIGMSEEFRKHIWEAYSRENTEVVHEIQGTGLGMVIVQNIVSLMQGTIELRSETGKGSEFIITLPLKPSSGDIQSPVRETSYCEAMNRSYEGHTILVVDDTPINLKLAERILSSFGFAIINADNGEKAISIVADSGPGDIDLILMDVMMPVLNGLEATKRIRSMDDPKLSKIPIIAMTANAFESDIQTVLDAGMDAHIAKPFKKEELIAKISKYINTIED